MNLRLLLPLLLLAPAYVSAEPVRLARDPALSPDGKSVAFSWQGDIWTVPTVGGRATRLTSHAATESNPAFSPDGKSLAFNSDRTGSDQIFVMPVTGGEPRQITWHTDGYQLHEWLPDGKSVLVGISRDFTWTRATRSERLAIVHVQKRHSEQTLFDDYGNDGTVSPNGKRVLFMREGSESWWRQGFRGSRAGQIWQFQRDRDDKKSFQPLLSDQFENRWPMWDRDGKRFYFVSNRDGAFNLWRYDLDEKESEQLTHFKEDSVVFPAISRDGRTLVFRVRFDLYCWSPGDKEPSKIAIEVAADGRADAVERMVLDKASDISFTADGLQMAFITGGDVWVMDTELKEPRRVTRTAEEERSVLFAPDGKSLLFVSDAEGQTDLWRAEPADAKKTWWESERFTLRRVTNDAAVESRMRFSRDGKRLAYVRERGELWIADGDGKNAQRLIQSWNAPSYEFSPDGAWIVYSLSDEWFNDDIWLRPLDGSRPAFNLSQHPDNDQRPVWSPDGKMIAWTGQREFDEVDIFYVNLLAEEDEKTRRERRLQKAREKFKTAAKAPAKSVTKSDAPADDAKADAKTEAKPETKETTLTPPVAKPVQIDFDGLHERIHRVTIAKSAEHSLIWSPDSKKLAFQATIEGKAGTYTIELPDEPKPVQLSVTSVQGAQWLKSDELVGLSEGKPVSVSAKGGAAKLFPFRAQHSFFRAEKQRAVFDQCWQVMRDYFYDDRLGNKDWNTIRAKYRDMAAESPDMNGVAECVQLMLGELNGSHLGFSLNSAAPSANTWQEETAHLGLRFDRQHRGPGWKVRDVLPKGPTSRRASHVEAGEFVLKVDGKEVSPTTDPSEVLNGPLDRDIALTVQAAKGETREVTLRPISYGAARRLLYDAWIQRNREAVEKSSQGTMGYLHISAMDDASFQKFQEELYHAGAGKEGMIIDVRENGGGSTTDHLLTALTQPRHALTIPRGGDTPGYPQDRMVYATWHKPIAVLCNQNSYSNAEIFSHAIKVLQRGKLIGVPTAGGVISTGATSIMDVGRLRVPFRGWYGIRDGQDMELHGAVPDHVVWPKPGDYAKGIDRQLNQAIEVLRQDIADWKTRPQPKLIKASER